MPVLESTDHITPKSALRHRPIAKDGEQVITLKTPVVKRASRTAPHTEDAHVEVDEWQRTAGDDHSPKPTRASSRRIAATTASKALPKTLLSRASGSMATKRILQQHGHPLFYLGIGMLGMLALWVIVTSIIGCLNTTMDDIHYGNPRTFQTDAFVGHNESGGTPSHFIAINLHGHIEVIEFPGGDLSHARIFLGPQLYTANSDLVVVTLKFIDVNGDHKPDMIIGIHDTGWLGFSVAEQELVYINDQGTFRQLRPEEHRQVEQFLQNHSQSTTPGVKAPGLVSASLSLSSHCSTIP